MPGETGIAADGLERHLSGLDALELPTQTGPSRLGRALSAAWPKLAAAAFALLVWQTVVWAGWKPGYLLPGPFTVVHHLWADRHPVASGVLTTLRRAVEYYGSALITGTVAAWAATRWRPLRDMAVPLTTGLQSMPSVAWVPIGILLFGVKPEAILFVTLAGSVPAVIIGTIAAIDAVPPILLHAGAVMGARGLNRFRYIVFPAALPGYIAGMRQAWAFAWRSLMAGELIVAAHGTQSLGQLLSAYQDQSLAADVLAVMLAILAVGLLMDGLVFSRLEQAVLVRRGLRAA